MSQNGFIVIKISQDKKKALFIIDIACFSISSPISCLDAIYYEIIYRILYRIMQTNYIYEMCF